MLVWRYERAQKLTDCLGYKQYNTGRQYMALMGDWRNNKDEEIELDGIGGVNILVKADVHRSGTCFVVAKRKSTSDISNYRHQLSLICL